MSYNKQAYFYDFLYANKPYQQECEFIHEILGDMSSLSVLELAGGTGSHAYFLAPLSREYTFTEYSKGMLKIAKTKLEGIVASNRLISMDMTNFRPVRGSKFDIIICLFDSIGYVITNEKIVKTLENIRETLIDGGLAIIEYWNGLNFVSNFDKTTVREIIIKEGVLKRTANVKVNYTEQISDVEYTFFIDGQEQFRENHRNRYFFPKEFGLLVKRAGLEIQDIHYDYGQHKDVMKAWHCLAILKKK